MAQKINLDSWQAVKSLIETQSHLRGNDTPAQVAEITRNTLGLAALFELRTKKHTQEERAALIAVCQQLTKGE